MTFVPRRAGVLQTLSQQMISGHGGTLRIHGAIAAGKCESWITTRIGGSRARGRGCGKLWKAIERLIGIPKIDPVLPHGAEVMIKGSVFLGHENDVIHRRL